MMRLHQKMIRFRFITERYYVLIGRRISTSLAEKSSFITKSLINVFSESEQYLLNKRITFRDTVLI